MRPRIQLLTSDLIGRILGEAFELLMSPGVRVGSAPVVKLLRPAGVEIHDGVAHLPEPLVRNCLATAPRDFYLYNRQGEKAVHYGGDDVHFDPGSCCVQILDPGTLEARPAETRDLVRLIQVTETLPQFAAQSTALVCSDVPSAIGDLYRLLVVLIEYLPDFGNTILDRKLQPRPVEKSFVRSNEDRRVPLLRRRHYGVIEDASRNKFALFIADL